MPQLTTEQLTQLNNFYSEGRYADAYRVITDNVSNDYGAYQWFDLATGINEGEGYASAYIRGYTVIAEALGDLVQGENLTLISSEELQTASDLIADSVLREIINNNGELPTEQDIYNRDAKLAKDFLELNLTEWGGIFPAVIGAINYDGDLPQGYEENRLVASAAYFASIYAGVAGTRDLIELYFEEVASLFGIDLANTINDIDSFFESVVNSKLFCRTIQ